MMAARQDVLLNWKFDGTFGWGILGLNVFCQWANDPEIRPLMGEEIQGLEWHLTDPLRQLEVIGAVDAANAYLRSIEQYRVGEDIVTEAIVVDPLGSGGRPSHVYGVRHVGRCIFEDTRFGSDIDFGKYDALLVGSRWNAEILGGVTSLPVEVIAEGVDTSVFCPGPKSGILNPDCFYVFSGGKIEYRKGQDLVLLAFREFARRHPDAILVTSWHSPWPQAAVGFRGKLDYPVAIGPQGWLDIIKWAADNGVPRRQVIDIGRVANHRMPHVLREMDLCVQPSRAEACTNLPVKEAMACGVPVIAGYNTGMRDLLTAENSLILTQQGRVDLPGGGTEGWGESDIEEMLAHMEWAYNFREEARALGLSASRWIEREGRTWRVHAQKLKTFLVE